ncbi:ABC-2 family transporter protein [Novipirellula aureliae]|uniref:ABC-2 family transporter protein n=1 Tax=Novipirellula aureliae TaxID=2527966 RepID=A0A5C6E379_9BACT|nr:ABC transporter permease [Novipirellula aureliae]TWU42964.1 ABC-2 family transporter protein [Novipirellula aureliae]
MSTTTAASRPSRFNTWLIWKDVCQVIPLVVALLLVVGIIVAFQYWNSELRTSQFYVSIELTLLVLPGIFATGVGAVMVGQERENRTIDWLSSLPITPRQLFLSKVAVGVVGLAIMWLIAVLSVTLLVGSDANVSRWRLTNTTQITQNLTPISFPLWIIHSLFVMLAGFYTSWRVKNQFFSLVALMALATVPFLASIAISEFGTLRGRVYPGTEFFVWLGVSLLLIPVSFLAGYRRAEKVLSPAEATTLSPLKRFQAHWVAAEPPTFHSGTAAIVWQSIHSSWFLFPIILALMIGVFFDGNNAWNRGLWFSFAGHIGMPLAVCWLAVSVFKFAGTPEQLRFLADRGISPTKVYIARHAVPIAVVATGIVIYTFYATYVLSSSDEQPRPSDWPSLLQVTLSCAGIYAVSQWISQLIRTTTIAFMIAPLVAISATYSRLYHFVPDVRWQVFFSLLFALVPMLGTWAMMQRYMDRRDSPGKYLIVPLFLMLFGVISIATIYIDQWHLIGRGNEDVGAFTISQREARDGEGKSVAESTPTYVLIESEQFNDVPLEYTSEFKKKTVTQLMQADLIEPEDLLTNLEQLRDDRSLAAKIDSNAWQGFLIWATLEQVKFENASGTEAFDEFAPWIDTASLLVASLRRSHRWFDQEVADRTEIWLASLLSSEAMKPYRSEAVIQTTLDRLPSRSERNRVRRTAILASWATWPYTAEDNFKRVYRDGNELLSINGLNLGGMELIDAKLTEKYVWMSDAEAYRVEQIATAALAATRQSELGPIPRDPNRLMTWWEEVLHDATVASLVPAEIGPYSARMRRLPAMMTMVLIQGYPGEKIYPAQYIAMPWETTVESLKESKE